MSPQSDSLQVDVALTRLGEAWLPGVPQQLGYYVYLLVAPETDTAFYVGKGIGGRCFSHLNEARSTLKAESRTYEKLDLIRQVESAGRRVRIEILRHGLSEAEAFTIESVAIDLLGFDRLTNRVHGHSAGRRTVADLNAHLGARPVVFEPDDDLLLIRVSRKFYRGISTDELYEATRRWWRVGTRRSNATHALAVHEGVVRGVYRIDGWEQPEAEALAGDADLGPRWGFWGEPDPDAETRFLFRDVSDVFSQGSQNPITYVGCRRGG